MLHLIIFWGAFICSNALFCTSYAHNTPFLIQTFLLYSEWQIQMEEIINCVRWGKFPDVYKPALYLQAALALWWSEEILRAYGHVTRWYVTRRPSGYNAASASSVAVKCGHARSATGGQAVSGPNENAPFSIFSRLLYSHATSIFGGLHVCLIILLAPSIFIKTWSSIRTSRLTLWSPNY